MKNLLLKSDELEDLGTEVMAKKIVLRYEPNYLQPFDVNALFE